MKNKENKGKSKENVKEEKKRNETQIFRLFVLF